ncbi:UNVERIFIED_CONTAM: hypothetical protein NY603_22165, partial [Bacteroidetes bacterium 56_B9]
LDNFFKNFFRQCKEPSRFGFYRIAADQAENLLEVMKQLLKDPEANKELLAPHKVDTSDYEKKVQETLRVLRFCGGALGCAVRVQPGYHADLAC